jgi:hypothetical protein
MLISGYATAVRNDVRAADQLRQRKLVSELEEHDGGSVSDDEGLTGNVTASLQLSR